MAHFTIPAGWELDTQADNQVVFTVTGHTATENYQVLFDKKPMRNNGGKFTTPEYRIRIRRTFVDAEGNPLSTVCLFDSNLRWHPAAAAADIKAMVDLAGDIFSDVNLAADIVDQMYLPRP